MDRGQHLPVEGEAVGCTCGRERDFRALQIERACDKVPLLDELEQLADAALRRKRLEHELNRASTGKAELARIFRGNTVGDRLRPLDVSAFAPRALDDVILDAAARYRADHVPVVPHCEQRTRRPRRAAPGLDHGHEEDAPAGGQPFGALAQRFEVDAIHGNQGRAPDDNDRTSRQRAWFIANSTPDVSASR